jgi:hypothetical protein
MQTPFNALDDSSRIWIYQSDRKITADEQTAIQSTALDFMTKWAAHGQDLKASATIKYDHFLIIATDESFNMASGCSIDSSVHFVQQLSENYGIDFFDRMKLAFLSNNEVKIIPLNELKSEIANEQLTAESQFFNNTITTKGDLNENWLVNAGNSWLKRYFKVHESV